MIRPSIRHWSAPRAGIFLLVGVCAAGTLSLPVPAQEKSRASNSVPAEAGSSKAKPSTTGAIKANVGSASGGWTAETKRPPSAPSSTPAAPTAPPGTKSPSQFDDWVLTCDTGKDSSTCALIQRLADQKGRKVVQFRAARTPTAAYLEVSAPLGLSIPYGVTLALPDKSAIKMELAVCDTSGCRAVVPLTEENLAKFKSDGRIGVRFQDSRSGKVLTVYGSLKGFTSGVTKLLSTG